ncbi:hypothetical protein B4U80_04965, partial [Leptotrombidium deliense]
MFTEAAKGILSQVISMTEHFFTHLSPLRMKMVKSQSKKQICIIGAGSAGLTAIKQCLDQNLDVVCFEKTDNFGGLWRYREDDVEGVPSVAKTTVINSSKEMSAFSDFVPPDDFPNYMGHKHMCKYLELYANQYDLLQYIRYNHCILNVNFNEDHEQTGKWKVTVLKKDENSIFEQIFDGVMVCVGHHVKPNIPTFPSQETFKGRILHTHSYKTSIGFEDKVAVVVGIGNSGGDVAVDLSHVCSQVYLVTRSGCWVNYRVNLNGKPLDFVLTTRLMNSIMAMLPYNTVCSYFEYYVNTFFNHEIYGLKPEHRMYGQHLMANDMIANFLISGKLQIRKNIEHFTENGVVFEGMEKETKCDVVVLATGYDISFPFIDSAIIDVNNNKVRLFKNTFQPNLKHAHTLAIIGLVQPTGALFPISELQSRWFALLMKGERKLPKKEQMLKVVDEDINAMKNRYYDSNRHTIEVDYIEFLDLLASYVGCKPNLCRYAITDPKLWYHLLFSPCMSYQYRLAGPNRWEGARDAILSFRKRYSTPFKTKAKLFNYDLRRKLICVIGAGSSGLWKYRDEDMQGVGSVAKTTIINTSKEMSAFSDFVPPDNFPNYMDNRHTYTYFEMYAKHNDLLKHIRFNHEVLNITFNDDYEETGKWKVTAKNKESEKTFSCVFDGVMVCNGHHVIPNIPTFPGQDNFNGKIMHTHSYKKWNGFEDKVVVVVGIGNSGCDVAAELSVVCSQVYIASRTSSWINHRVNYKGQPIDFVLQTRVLRTIASMLPTRVWCTYLESYVNSFFNHELYGLKPKHRISAQNHITNDLIAQCIITGNVLVRKNIKCFTENGVVFEGMEKETKCDVVILATGYKISFPFIDESIVAVEKNKVRLFKNLFQPNLKHPQTLAMIALVHPNGSKFPIAEMQSRWFALLMKGDLKLPTKEEMFADIEKEINLKRIIHHGSERHTTQVDFIGYMDDIASFVGCKPNLLRFAITDPKLWYHLFFSPCMPYQYRLSGPNKWFAARDAIINYEQRVVMAFK